MDSLSYIQRSKRLFLRHERFLPYLLILLILIAGVYTQVVTLTIGLVVIPALSLLPFLLTRVQQYHEREHAGEYFSWPLHVADSIVVGLGITSLNFMPTPSLALLAILVLRMAGRVSLRHGIAMLAVCLVTMFFLAYVLGIEAQLSARTPVLLAITAIASVFLLAIVDILQAEQQIQEDERQIEKSRREAMHFMHMANKISRYAPTQVWQSILRGDRDTKIDNKRRRLSIFFSDIQGFTELSERLMPDDLAEILNTYFERMTEIANRYGGTVDKFIGDGLLIFFGDPVSKGDREDALACVEMAMAMRREIRLLQQHWVKNGFEGLTVRMGIATGYCHVGNFGTTSRISYTVIGRDANLAARLQSAAAPGEILISQATFMLIRDQIICKERGTLQLKGIAQPVPSWVVVEPYANASSAIRRWTEVCIDGFNLQLDLDEVKEHDVERISRALQEAGDTLKRGTGRDKLRPPL